MSSFKKLFFIVLFTSCAEIGEDYEWKENNMPLFYRNFGTLGYDYGRSVAYSPFDNGIIIAGSQQPILEGQRDMWAIKTNSQGLVIWERVFGGTYNEEAYDVIATSDGGYLFIGYSWSFGNNQQIYAVKVDYHGRTEWSKTYGGSMWEVGNSVIEVKGGGYAVTGFSNSPGISSGNTDIILLRIDNSGNQLWMKSYGNKIFPNHEWGNDIIQMDDNGFLIVGARDRYEDGKKNILIIRVDEDGNIIWEKELLGDNNENETAYSVSRNISGQFIICSGISSKSDNNIYKPKITIMDAYGNISWERAFSSNSKEYHQFRAISTYNNDILIVGSSINESSFGDKADVFITKTDAIGNILWSKAYGTPDFDDWGWSINEKPDGNILVIGSTKSFESSLFDIFLIQTNSQGQNN